jgi:hypothetical protein
MTHQDIIRHLCLKYPLEVIHEITTENIISDDRATYKDQLIR